MSEPEEKKSTLHPFLLLYWASVAVIVAGFSFRLMHWPNSVLMVTVGCIGAGVFYLLLFLRKPVKSPREIIKVVLVFVWVLCALFVFNHWPGTAIFRTVLPIALVAWAFFVNTGNITTDPTEYRSSNHTSKTDNRNTTLNTEILDSDAEVKRSFDPLRYTHILFIVAASLTTIGTMFKIAHIPGGGIMLIAGLCIGIVWYVWDIIWK